jgi:uracil-DNA glycosylase family 4
MAGFFTAKEMQSTSRPNGKRYSCAICGLYKEVESPRLPPVGEFKKKILVVGESPTELDDKAGSYWQGSVGKYLKRTFETFGIDFFVDCLNVNACHCRTFDEKGKDREPVNHEVDCCRKTTLNIIATYKPKLVILFGDSAVYSVIGNRWKKDLDRIGKWRGWNIPDLDLNTWVCPTFHPKYVIENQDTPIETIWLQDLTEAFARRKEPLFIYQEPKIEIIEDLSIFDSITSGEVAIDYETTGIKPHAEGHRIVCAAVADNENHAYVFMMPKSRKERAPFVRLLADENVKKIAQNMKFEEAWSVEYLRQPVKGWIWDTMLASHLLDNRQKVTSLKFQTYVQFGIIDYDSEVAPYLKCKVNDSANGINQIMDLVEKPGGKEMLMNYCGLDAVYEFRLAKKQSDLIWTNSLPF